VRWVLVEIDWTVEGLLAELRRGRLVGTSLALSDGQVKE